MRFFIQYQPFPGSWQTYQSRNDPDEAQQMMEIRAFATGQKHRLIDDDGNLIVLFNP